MCHVAHCWSRPGPGPKESWAGRVVTCHVPHYADTSIRFFCRRRISRFATLRTSAANSGRGGGAAPCYSRTAHAEQWTGGERKRRPCPIIYPESYYRARLAEPVAPL